VLLILCSDFVRQSSRLKRRVLNAKADADTPPPPPPFPCGMPSSRPANVLTDSSLSIDSRENHFLELQESGQLIQRLHSAASIDGATREALEVLGHLSLASWLSLAKSTPRAPGAASGSLASWSSVGMSPTGVLWAASSISSSADPAAGFLQMCAGLGIPRIVPAFDFSRL